MAKLIVIYDEHDRVNFYHDDIRRTESKLAMMPIAEDLENKDIYELAKKLASMLLEQL